jgi:hypothetical protein
MTGMSTITALGAVSISIASWTLSGCGGDEGSKGSNGKKMSGDPTTISRVDPTNSHQVYKWSSMTCATLTREMLQSEYGISLNTKSPVVKGISRAFPPATRDAAQRGCRSGLRRR